GKFVVAKSMSATALPLAWLTQTMSGVALASTPIWTVPQVVVSGVLGAAVPAGVGGMHSTEGFVVTCKTVGNVFPRSVERAKNTLNTSLPSPLICAVGCSQAIFTLLLESTATCGKADGASAEPEGAMLTPGVKLLPP